MEYRFLGDTGLRVSVLSFGSWVTFKNQVDAKAAYELMKEAYLNGVNFFDNAETYAAGDAETVMGKAVQMGIDEKVWSRDDLVLSTKLFFGYKTGPNNTGLSRKHIIEGMKASLKRLNMEYVDIVMCHRPDPYTPIEETVRAMNHVINMGWAFYWGTSEWSAQQITEACRIADKLNLIRPIADQPQYNMFVRDRVEVEYQPLYKEFKWGTTIWSPLASGILTGKYSKHQIPEGSRLSLQGFEWLKEMKMGQNGWQIDKADELKPVADKLGCSLGQLAIAWCIKNKGVSTVITGATSLAQMKENLAALNVVSKLTQDVMDEIEKILGNKPQLESSLAMAHRIRAYTFTPPKKD